MVGSVLCGTQTILHSVFIISNWMVGNVLCGTQAIYCILYLPLVTLRISFHCHFSLFELPCVTGVWFITSAMEVVFIGACLFVSRITLKLLKIWWKGGTWTTAENVRFRW